MIAVSDWLSFLLKIILAHSAFNTELQQFFTLTFYHFQDKMKAWLYWFLCFAYTPFNPTVHNHYWSVMHVHWGGKLLLNSLSYWDGGRCLDVGSMMSSYELYNEKTAKQTNTGQVVWFNNHILKVQRWRKDKRLENAKHRDNRYKCKREGSKRK